MAKKRKKNSTKPASVSPAQNARANLKNFNWKLALLLFIGSLLSSVLYFLLAGYRISLYVLFAYIIADCGVILGYFIYNRGFVDKDATLDNLPDTMTIEEKQDYIDSIALRKKKSRWMPIMIIILSVPLMLDTLNIFVIEGLFGWKIF
jgi:polyferredoxin